jgi:hypothetical protein
LLFLGTKKKECAWVEESQYLFMRMDVCWGVEMLSVKMLGGKLFGVVE